MKLILAVVIALFFGIVSTGCTDNLSAAKQIFPPPGVEEVQKDVYDNSQDMVYIEVDNGRQNVVGKSGTLVSMMDIINKKNNWQKQFPAKKVVAIFIITSEKNYYSWNNNNVVGLLIQYEQR